MTDQEFRESKEYKLAEAFTDAVNGNFSRETFNKAMSIMHRELQSQAAMVMIAWIWAVGKDDYAKDGRNEWIKVYADTLAKNRL